MGMAGDCGFLLLPNELILQIMSYLTTSEVMILSRVCRRLAGLFPDRSLWMDVDLRLSSLKARQLGGLLRNLHTETRRVCLRGHVTRDRPPRRPALVTARILTDMQTRCKSLVELRLEKCLLNAEQVSLELLPPTLCVLSLSGSEVARRRNSRSYFHRLCEFCPLLAELDLSRCGWVDSHALLPLSKLERLRRLVLRACPRLGGEVAYSSIACMLGFRALQELDVRRTSVSDSDVSSFSQLPQLSALLLEPRGAPLDGDAALRQLGQHRGDQLRQLALRCCRLTDGAAARLPEQLPALRRLDLSHSQLSAERLGWLCERLPRCAVSRHGAPRRRRRRRSDEADDDDGQPTEKRLRRCECLSCAESDGSDGPEPEPEPEPEPDVDWENQPGVIVVDLFGGRGPIAAPGPAVDEHAPAGDAHGREDAAHGPPERRALAAADPPRRHAAAGNPPAEEVAAVDGFDEQHRALPGPGRDAARPVPGPAMAEDAAARDRAGERDVVAPGQHPVDDDRSAGGGPGA